MCKECGHDDSEHYVDFVGVEYDDFDTAFYFVAWACDVKDCECYITPDVDEDDYLFYKSLARRSRPRLGD